MPSEVIKDFHYDEVTKTLFITFQSGELYAYAKVEPECPEAMAGAFSRGQFFAEFVRGFYPYAKVEDPAAVQFKPPDRDLSSRPPLPRRERTTPDSRSGGHAWRPP